MFVIIMYLLVLSLFQTFSDFLECSGFKSGVAVGSFVLSHLPYIICAGDNGVSASIGELR